jgi:hypothetical protein
MNSNHQLINMWLSSQKQLSEEQQEMVKAHKLSCETCRQQDTAWEQVTQVFRTVGQSSPAPGFSGRWQQRLAVQRVKEQRRKSWLFFWISGSTALVTLILLAFQVWHVLRTPAQLLVGLVYLVTSILAFANSIGEYLTVFDIVAPSVTLIGLMFFIGFISLLSVLWVVMFQKFSSIRRVV